MEIVKQLNLNGNPQTVPNGSLVYAKNIKLSLDGTYISNDDGFSTAFNTETPTERLRLKVSNIVGKRCTSLLKESYYRTVIIDEVETVIKREYKNTKILGNINCPNEIVIFTKVEYTDYIIDDYNEEQENNENIEPDIDSNNLLEEENYDEENIPSELESVDVNESQNDEEPIAEYNDQDDNESEDDEPDDNEEEPAYDIYKEGEENNIYRAVEIENSNKLCLFEVDTAWQYDGGTIVGTYTYNIYGNLIIAIAEYNGDKDKQLITIDLNDSSSSDNFNKYSCAPNIPIANLNFNNKVKGNAMANGLYYFFIRYEIAKEIYSDWFPIGAPQFALSLEYKTLFNHTYKGTSDGSVTKDTDSCILINTNNDSNYNFDYTLSFDKTYNYLGYQIGYILQTDNAVVCRLWKKFSFIDENDISKSFIFNGGYIEELGLEEVTKNVINFYDIKCLANYNNKLYIANFKETEYNIDPSTLINPSTNKPYHESIDTYIVRSIVKQSENETTSLSNLITWTFKITGHNPVSITIPENVISITLKDFPDLVSLLNSSMTFHSLLQQEERDVLTLMGPMSLVLLGDTDELRIMPQYTNGVRNWWLHQDGEYIYGWLYKSFPMSQWDYCWIEDNKIKITKEKETKNYKTFSVDNTVRTLMPFGVYAFYVHYVRPDGSYTNGIPLENKIPDDYHESAQNYDTLYKLIRDVNFDQVLLPEIKEISTIEEIKNKYVYEVLYGDNSTNGIKIKDYFDLYINDRGKKLFKALAYTPRFFNHVSESLTEETNYITRLGVRFENITYPPGYVGAFFSYEKVNDIALYQGIVTNNSLANSNVLIKALDVETANINFNGSLFIPTHKIDNNGNIHSLIDTSDPGYDPNHPERTPLKYEPLYINSAAPIYSNSSITFEGSEFNRRGLDGGIVMNLSKNSTTHVLPEVGTVGTIVVFNRSIYNNDNKELIPFGPITTTEVYGEDCDLELDDGTNRINNKNTIQSLINYNMNYPSYVCNDKILTYNNSISIDEECNVFVINNNTIDTNTPYNGNNYAKVLNVLKYSNFNSLCFTIKKEPEDKVGILTNNKLSVNTFVRPSNASDLFELKSHYIPQIHKAYTNYNSNINNKERFANIIRCSYPIRTESTFNGWRIFNPEIYYIIDNVHGEINNIFGLGTSFYVHTRHNLLLTSSNTKLTADNTTIHLQQNHIFDIEPTEIFTSDLGYGGIKYQNNQLFSQYGYIWYDSDNRKLFRLDNGKLIDLGAGIENILKEGDFKDCRINIDSNSNRIFFCFDFGYITLGYDTLSNKWLSIYDFVFDMNIHTANKIVLCNGYTDLFVYDDSVTPCDYDKLYNCSEHFSPYWYGAVKHLECYFDIIFNDNYLIPKVLNSIRWAHEIIELNNNFDKKHPAQLEYENDIIVEKYKDLNGLKLLIYSDAVDTGLLSLECDKLNDVADPNNPDAYKYPYYEKGVWNLNYFRNNITSPITEEELNTLAQQQNINVNALKNVYKIINRNGQIVYRISDLRSLIYGKYFVVRFKFDTNKRVKFDNLIFNIQKY